jgi:hypothetical protein
MSSNITNKPGLGVGRDEVGAALSDLRNEVNQLQTDNSVNTGVTVGIPEPANPFVIAYRRHPKGRGVFARMRALVPTSGGGTDTIETVIIKTAGLPLTGKCTVGGGSPVVNGSSTRFLSEVDIGDVIINPANAESHLVKTVASDTVLTTDANWANGAIGAAFNAATLGSELEGKAKNVLDIAISGQIDYEFADLLEYNTQYGLVRLITIQDDGSQLKNPPKFFPLPLNRYLGGVTFTTPVAFGVPSDPSSGAPFLQANQLDPDTTDHFALATFRMYAPLSIETGAAQTWQQANVDQVIFVIQRGTQKAKHYPVNLSGAELTQTDPAVVGGVANRGYVDFTLHHLTVGESITWVKNICWVGSEKAVSVGAAVQFFAGSFTQDPTKLTGVNVQITTNADPYNSKVARVDLLYHQPAIPVSLKWAMLERKVHGTADGTYQVVVDRFSLKKQEYHQANTSYDIVIDEHLTFKPSTVYTLRLTLMAIGGVSATFIFDNISTGVDPNAVNDTAKPSGLATPAFVFSDKADLHFSGMTVGSNFNQPADPAKSLVVYGPAVAGQPIVGGVTYLDLPTFMSSGVVQGAASEALAQLPIGNKDHDNIPIRLKQLRNFYGFTGASLLIHGYFYASNQAFGQSLPSAVKDLDLASPFDNVDASGAVNVTNVGQSMISTQNLLFNGHFHYQKQATQTCKGWLVSIASGQFIPPAGQGLGVEFDVANHRLHWVAGISAFPTQRLGDASNQINGFNVDRGDWYTVGIVMWSSVSTFTTSMRVALLTFIDADRSAGQANAVMNATITPVPTLYQFKFQIPQGAFFNTAFWLQIQSLDFGVNNVQDLFIDLVGMNAGQQFTAYSPRAAFELSNSGNEFWDAPPNFTGSQGAQAVSPTGPTVGGATLGGGAAPGTGKAISLL